MLIVAALSVAFCALAVVASKLWFATMVAMHLG